jgi:hypothetical protein
LWPLWQQPLWALLLLVLLISIGLLLFRIKRNGWLGWRSKTRRIVSARSAIEFYERLIRMLAARGINRAPDQTPLEFATSTGVSEALIITAAYNRVRFGAEELSASELRQIETFLTKAEQEEKQSK